MDNKNNIKNTNGIATFRLKSEFAMAALKELFYALLTALVIFVIMELIKPNIVQAYININLLLIFWLAVGIVLLVVNFKS